jgi:hypothetical protein
MRPSPDVQESAVVFTTQAHRPSLGQPSGIPSLQTPAPPSTQYTQNPQRSLDSDHFVKDWRALLDRIEQLEEQVRRIGPLERQIRDLQAETALARLQPFANHYNAT